MEKTEIKYEIMPGDEHDAELLSGKLNGHVNSCVPRGHKYIPLDSKVTDGDGRMIAGFVGGVDGWKSQRNDVRCNYDRI